MFATVRLFTITKLYHGKKVVKIPTDIASLLGQDNGGVCVFAPGENHF